MASARKTKIVCTIGPASNSPEMIERLIRGGMDVARLNFSHGTKEGHEKVIKSIRNTAERLKKAVAILQDLQGPKIRTGMLKDGRVILKSGNRFILTGRNIIGTSGIVSTTYHAMGNDVKRGDRILLDDGLINLRVNDVKGLDIICDVINGGILTNHRGINLPGIKVGLSSITDKDIKDLIFGIRHGVDYVAISFVRSVKDVKSVKDIIKKRLAPRIKHGAGSVSNKKGAASIPVIAKLEKPEAIENLEKIMNEADGVMVARGDLGAEMSPEAVPVIQKNIISMANKNGRPVITATQMLESMINNPRPTRAEASDVANAIFDGTDAVMLSGETAAGKYPLESLEMMSKIISAAEKGYPERAYDRRRSVISDFPGAVSSAAVHAANQTGAKLIVVFTQSGSTALLVSKQRPSTKIIAYTPFESIVRRLNLYWGVMPKTMGLISDTDDLIREMDRDLALHRLAKKGDVIVILMGTPIFIKGATNMMKLHRVGEY